MKFIVACVGFSLIVLFSLVSFLLENVILSHDDSTDKHEYVVIRKTAIERINIHDLIVFNTEPKTFAIAGRSDSLGRRQLLTSMDSVLSTSPNFRWAKGVFASFDWVDRVNPIYQHRGSYIPFYNLDTRVESDVIDDIYVQKRTNRHLNNSGPFSFLFFLGGILIFFIAYFAISVSQDWNWLVRIVAIVILYFICFFILYSMLFFGSSESEAFKNGGSVLLFHAIHWFLYGVMVIFHWRLKNKYKSEFVFQGVMFLVVVFAFPIARMLTLNLIYLLDDTFWQPYLSESIWDVGSITENVVLGFGMGFAGLVVFLKRHYQDVNDEKKLALQSQLRTKDQLNSLNARLNPHFLYNALNSIAGLIHQDATKAEEMTLAVSRFLKHFSNRKEQHVITVKEEVDIIVDYISIEKIRFGEKLIFTHEVDPLCMSEDIPRSILQPLIENAVKYGYNSNEDLIKVSLEIKKKDGQLIIRVYDSGRPFDESLDKGYGLSSVYNKLDLLYKNNYTISYLNDPEKHIEIVIYLINPTHHA